MITIHYLYARSSIFIWCLATENSRQQFVNQEIIVPNFRYSFGTKSEQHEETFFPDYFTLNN